MLSRFEAGGGGLCLLGSWSGKGWGPWWASWVRRKGGCRAVLPLTPSVLPLCPMLREKENQLLVMVSTTMPRCARGASPPIQSWQPCWICWWFVVMPGAAPCLLDARLWGGFPCSPLECFQPPLCAQLALLSAGG